MAKTFKIVNGDIVFTNAGRPAYVEGREKARQDVAEMLAIDEQPNGFGAGIKSLVGLIEGDTDISLLLSRQVRRATDRFTRLLDNNQRVIRSDAEVIVGLTHLAAGRVSGSRTEYQFRAEFQTREAKIKQSGIISLG